tara:strand:- start:709 stop:1326 length:618 start_codon:yes stop_codon:yes gene_type:complete
MASNPNLREGTARAIANKLAAPVAEKYPRGANIEKFMKDSFDYQMGLNAGGTESTDDSGITRLNLVNKGVKDDLGRTILSMQKPTMTAMPPTLSQLGGDFMRGLGSLMENVNPISFIPGANALVSGVNAVKDIFFPDPPVVTTGGSVTGSVTEEPLSSGVIDVLPNNFVPVLKTKPDLPMGDRLRTMDMMYDFYNLPIDKPELYG